MPNVPKYALLKNRKSKGTTKKGNGKYAKRCVLKILKESWGTARKGSAKCVKTCA